MPLREALLLICPIFLLPPSASQSLDLRPMQSTQMVDADCLAQLAWRYRAENPNQPIEAFIASHQYYLVPWDICD